MDSANFDASVVFSEEILKGKKIEFFTVSPINEMIGVSALFGTLKNMHLLRIYQLMLDEDKSFYPTA